MRDADRVSKSLALLEQSLNPHAFPELGRSLLDIYRYCQTLLDTQSFDEAAFYLRTLRDAWMKVKTKV